MILINDIWYNPFDLEDISIIIKDSFNYDLAQKMNKLIKENSYEDSYDDLSEKIDYLEFEKDGLEQNIHDLREEMEEMENKNNELEKENEELLDMVYNP